MEEPSVKFTVDIVLSLVGGGASREHLEVSDVFSRHVLEKLV